MAKRIYTDDERNEALRLYAEEGLAAAVKATGIPKGTIGGWASERGIRTFGSERTAAATAAHLASVEERKAALAEKLLEVAELGVQVEVRLLQGEASLRDVVGARTRAIHDLQLLTGAATGRTEAVHDPRRELGTVRDELAERRGQQVA